MPTFTRHCFVHDGFNSVEFAPGDVVPDWALGKVTNRVAEGLEAELFDGPDDTGEPAGDPEDMGGDEQPGADSQGDAQGDEQPADGDSGEPDFTKPAAAKPAAKRGPGRPKKNG